MAAIELCAQSLTPLWSEYGQLRERFGWMSNDGSTLVVRHRIGGSGHRVWDLAAGRLIISHSGDYDLHAPLNGRTVSADGRFILRRPDGSNLELVDVLSGELVAATRTATVAQTDISEDGRVVSLTEPEKVVLRALPSLEVLDTIPGAVFSQALSLDGRLLLRSTIDGLSIYDLQERRVIEETSLGAGASSCAFVDSGHAIAVFRQETRELMIFKGQRRLRETPSVTVLPRPSTILSAPTSSRFLTFSGVYANDQDVIVWDARTAQRLASYDLDTTEFDKNNDLGVGWQAGKLVVMEWGATAVCDLMTGRLERRIKAPWLWNAVFAHTGTELLVLGSSDSSRIVASETGESLRMFGVGEYRNFLRPSPTEPIVASMSMNLQFAPNILRITDMRTGYTRLSVDVSRGRATSALAWTPDGIAIAGGDEAGELWLRDTATGAVVRRFIGATGAIRSIDFSSDGDRIIAASEDSTIRIWSISTGTLQQTLIGHRNAVRSVAITGDGQRLISIGDDGRLLRWNSADGSHVVLDSSGRASRTVRVPGREWILVSTTEGIQVWDSVAERVIHRLEDPRGWKVTSEPDVLRVDPTGRFAALVRAGDIAVWSLDRIASAAVEGSAVAPFQARLLLHQPGEPARLRIESSSPLALTVDAVDAQGRTVLPRTEARVESGRSTLDVDCTRLSSGAYYVRVRSASHTVTLPIVVVR